MKTARLRSLRSPDGRVLTFRSVRAFAERHGLSRTGIHDVITGRQVAVGGWTRPSHRPRYAPTQLRAPDGTVHVVPYRGMSRFCQEHGLQPPNICTLVKGGAKSHKGWTHIS